MLQKIWNGDYTLPAMFWGLFLLVPVILRLVLLGGGFVTISDSTGKGLLFILLFGSFMLAYYVFVFIGTWRSADKYSKRRGGLFGVGGTGGWVDWGTVAKVAMVLILLTQGLTLF